MFVFFHPPALEVHQPHAEVSQGVTLFGRQAEIADCLEIILCYPASYQVHVPDAA
jgi:hypothetical protein